MRYSFLLLVLLFHPISPKPKWDAKKYAENNINQVKNALAPLSYVHLRGTECILDVGCGDGKITNILRQKVSKGRIIGIDVSPAMIAEAQKTYRSSNISFELKSATHLNITNQFDLVTSFFCLHWIKDQSKAFANITRSLKPGGKFVFTMVLDPEHLVLTSVAQLIKTENWKQYAKNFRAFWFMPPMTSIVSMLQKQKLKPLYVQFAPKYERFADRKTFEQFTASIPLAHNIPEKLQSKFITEVADKYLEQFPPNADGSINFWLNILSVVAEKPQV